MKRLNIPFAKVIFAKTIAKTMYFASSTKVWVQTGAAVNKLIVSGWGWSEVGARLVLHMDRNPDFRAVVHRVCVFALIIISLYSGTLAIVSYYLGRRKCGLLRAEIVRLTGRLREADRRQLEAQYMIIFLLEQTREDGSAAVASVASNAVAVYEETLAGIDNACFREGSEVTINNADYASDHLTPPKNDATSYGHRYEGGHLEVSWQDVATLAGMENACFGEGRSGTVSSKECMLEHLPSPSREATV